jgi:microcystin-dependent protein
MADISAANWSESDASNSAAAPDGAPEGMAPSGVNDVLRAHQGAVKRWYKWTTPLLTGGSSAAYTLSYSVSPGAVLDGMTHLVEFHTGNGASPTLNINGLGAFPIYYYSAGAWRPAPANLWAANWLARVATTAVSGAYRLIGFDNRTGVIEDWAGTALPPGCLLCNGQAIDRTTYAGLFSLFGGTYGIGNGSTTFNLPDLRSRATIGKSDMGGPEAAFLDGTVPRSTLGGVMGSQYSAGTVSVSGSATGTVNGATDPDPGFVAAAISGAGASPQNHQHTFSASVLLSVSASGATGSFSVLQPSMVINKLIRI